MYEPDYEGDMQYYQDQLAAKGITKQMFDMDNFAGLTANELQSIVNYVQPNEKGSLVDWGKQNG